MNKLVFKTIGIGVQLLLIFAALMVYLPNDVKADVDPAIYPHNLKVEWKGNGATITTPYPMLSWDNPTSYHDIIAVVVRVRPAARETAGCFTDAVVEHWFISSTLNKDGTINSDASVQPCSNGTNSPYILDPNGQNVPNSYIVPPSAHLNPNQTYYWSVNLYRKSNLTWYTSTGYISGQGGNLLSNDSFNTGNFTQADHNIFGVNVYANMQIKARGLENNPAGISQLLSNHLDWAKTAIGAGGYAKFYFYPIGTAQANDSNGANSHAKPEWIEMVNDAYQRNLIPVIRMQSPWVYALGVEPWDGFNRKPTDSDIQAYVNVVSELPKKAGVPLYLEIFNEMNYDNENWGDLGRVGADGYHGDFVTSSREYAQFFVKVKRAIKAANPEVKVLIGGLGQANDFDSLKVMLENPDFRQEVVADGVLGVHKYPASESSLTNPAGFQLYKGIGGNISPLGYKYLLDDLARAGINVDPVKILITEGGYHTNNDSLEQWRADKTLELMQMLQNDGTRIEGASLFALDHTYDLDLIYPTKRNDPNNLLSPTYADHYFWVKYTSGTTANGWPTDYFPIFAAVSNAPKIGYNAPPAPAPSAAPTPIIPIIPITPPAPKPTVVSYRVAETVEGLNSPSAMGGAVTSNNFSINYTFTDGTEGLKTIFVRYYYSDGHTTDTSAQLYYRKPIPVDPYPQVTNLKAQCSSDGKQVTVSWDAIPTVGGYLLRANREPFDDWKNDAEGDLGVGLTGANSNQTSFGVYPDYSYDISVQTTQIGEQYPFKAPGVHTQFKCIPPAPAQALDYPTGLLSGPTSAQIGDPITYTATAILTPGRSLREMNIWVAKDLGGSGGRVSSDEIEGFSPAQFNCQQDQTSGYSPACIWYRIGTTNSELTKTAIVKLLKAGNYKIAMDLSDSTYTTSSSTSLCSNNPYANYPVVTAVGTFQFCGSKALSLTVR